MHKELQIIIGVPSSTSLGFLAVTDDVPQSLDLLQNGLSVIDESGESGWIPKVANIKNGGVWIDSATSDGRTLNAGFDANVIESMRLVITGTTLQRSMALSNLMRVSRLCREFWSTDYNSQPVYLKWHADGANKPQYALLYDIGVDTNIDFLTSPDNGIITLSLEREPAWRAIAPGDNPQRYAKEVAGLEPSPVAGAGRYTYLDLSVVDGTGFVKQSVFKYDEIRTSNVNYIDFDPDDIPGDAPCLCLIGFANTIGKMTVARSTAKDLFPADNTSASFGGRARNTLNAGDATIASGGGLTTTKTSPADGLISNGSAVLRYVGNLAFAAGVVTNVSALSWGRTLQQLPNKYLAFVRLRVTAGAPATITLSLKWLLAGVFSQTNPSVTVTNTNRIQNLYLGTLDPIQIGSRLPRFDGTGIDNSSQVDFELVVNKTGAETATIAIADIILMPYDESIMSFDVTGFSAISGSRTLLDTTGFTSTAKKAVDAIHYPVNPLVIRAPSANPLQWSGTGIYLKPKVKNRLYFHFVDLDTLLASGFGPAISYPVNVNIVPRWYGVRDD
jgi:hypothetical protein